MPILPPKDSRDLGAEGKAMQRTVTLPRWIWKKIDEHSATLGYSPNEAVKEVLRQWVDETDDKSGASNKKNVSK